MWVAPLVSSALAAKPNAGLRWIAARFVIGTMWSDHATLCRNTHRSRGMAWRSAASTEHRISPAAWLTFHCEQCHLLYGTACGRLVSDAVAIASAANGDRCQARVLPAATALKR